MDQSMIITRLPYPRNPRIHPHHDSAVRYAIPRVVLADLRGSSCEPRISASGQNDALRPPLANLN